MQYNTMYDVYQELSKRFPEAYLDYNSSYDSISYVTENYEITALSNYNQPVLSIRNSSEQYQYNVDSLEDASGFISELLSGVISFSYDEFSASKRLKIDGWTNSKRKKKEKFTGKIAMTIGLILIIFGAVFSVFNFSMLFDRSDTFWGTLCPMPVWLGLFVLGLYMVINCNKIRFLDMLGYFTGVAVTALPAAIIMAMLDSNDIPLPLGAGLSAFFWFIGRIVRKNCVKHIQESDDIFLDLIPGPVYGEQNNENNNNKMI